jgi:hypothetical protein
MPSAVIFPNCGTNAATAASCNCSFDMMSFSWQLPACYDEELVSDFFSVQHWQNFREPDQVDEVPENVVRQGEFSRLYVSWGFHRLHCIYT